MLNDTCFGKRSGTDASLFRPPHPPAASHWVSLSDRLHCRLYNCEFGQVSLNWSCHHFLVVKDIEMEPVCVHLCMIVICHIYGYIPISILDIEMGIHLHVIQLHTQM